MNNIVIKSLTGISKDSLYEAFNAAFKDYERTWTWEEFENILVRNGYVPEISFGAFDGDRLVSFTLNAIGSFDGQTTAYDTGTGTIKDYRGKGLASEIFTTSIPYLIEAGASAYVLEVLPHNTKAVSIYSKLGFKVRRELNYFLQPKDDVKLNPKSLPERINLVETDLSTKDVMQSMLDYMPSWQNSFDSIARGIDHFKIMGAFHNGSLVGYGVLEPSSGDITQLAVSPSYRRQGIATNILSELFKYNRSETVKAINVETNCVTMNSFLAGIQFELKGKQFEMIRELS